MEKLKLEKLRLEDLSSIKIDFYMGVSKTVDYLDIMVIKYSGVYGFGSAGNSDAAFMYAMGKAALAAWEPSAVILDLSDLEYEWGDMLIMVLDIGGDQYRDAIFPTALVVGPKCEEAVRSLLALEGLDAEEWIFTDLEKAWDCIDLKLAKQS
jgi:hypothetical protein